MAGKIMYEIEKWHPEKKEWRYYGFSNTLAGAKKKVKENLSNHRVMIRKTQIMTIIEP